MTISNKLQYGFYVFLGVGDYNQPDILDKNWIATWRFEEWKLFIENIVKLKANTLMIYLNGHLLPYKSNYYPELIETSHPNVKDEFFSKVLSLAKSCGLNTIIVLSTTGHSAKYLEDNPNLGIKIRPGKVDFSKLLVAFPDHIRETKTLAQKGNAQAGLGTLCHNNFRTQQYTINLIKECLSIYNQIDGVALHPPESVYPCFCEYCCALFKMQHKKNMLEVNDDIARQFYLQSYLFFQKTYLENEIKSLLPKVQLYTFTIPWLFEPLAEKILMKISKNNIIIDWDYNLNFSRINQLNKRLLGYQMYNHSLWFMPTAGYGFDNDQEIQLQINKVKQQVKIAIDSKVSGIIHFIGPHLTMDLKKLIFFEGSSLDK